MPAVLGELFDNSVAGTLSTARIDKEQQFTIREWAATPGYFQWQEPMSTLGADVTCIEGSNGFTDEWGRFRQVTFTAKEFECRYDIVSKAMLEDGTVDETSEISF